VTRPDVFRAGFPVVMVVWNAERSWPDSVMLAAGEPLSRTSWSPVVIMFAPGAVPLRLIKGAVVPATTTLPPSTRAPNPSAVTWASVASRSPPARVTGPVSLNRLAWLPARPAVRVVP
jgi:hypothetical protein